MTIHAAELRTLPTASAYEDAVAQLFARRPERMVPGLQRIRAILDDLEGPQASYETVHITGTNGKTSTARMVTALLLAHGLRTGTYTSPHLQDVRERILVDGRPVSRQGFLHALGRVQAPMARTESRLGESVTFFEALTALGALCLREAAVDVGVIEVGMGGRWDATNVHDARVAVIGTVGLDHPELGATVTEVAGEKAGIIKRGASVVVGPQEPAADRVIAAEAASCDARLLRMGTAFDVLARLPVVGGQDLRLRIGERTYDARLPLQGAHQATNAACALAAADGLLAEAGGARPEAVRAAFAGVRSPGRFERFDREGAPSVVLDGAHNPAGAQALADGMREAFPGTRVVAVLGVLADKDVAGVVRSICAVADEVVVTLSPSGRAAPMRQLAEAVRRCGRPVTAVRDPVEALATAETITGPEGVVLVTGSLFLVGALRGGLGGPVA
jgi:dihydrofolate synthase/folylpolyglutamate synthase